MKIILTACILKNQFHIKSYYLESLLLFIIIILKLFLTLLLEATRIDDWYSLSHSNSIYNVQRKGKNVFYKAICVDWDSLSFHSVNFLYSFGFIKFTLDAAAMRQTLDICAIPEDRGIPFICFNFYSSFILWHLLAIYALLYNKFYSTF